MKPIVMAGLGSLLVLSCLFQTIRTSSFQFNNLGSFIIFAASLEHLFLAADTALSGLRERALLRILAWLICIEPN